MGLIKEPLNVDFEFDPKPLTNEEREKISKYIKAYKTKNAQKATSTKKASRLSTRKKVVA